MTARTKTAGRQWILWWWTALAVACAPEAPTPEAPAPQASAAPGLSISTKHLPTQADNLVREFHDYTDKEETYYRTGLASAHMHLIGIDQMCPLHIHRTTHEATIIVSGTADVTHIYAKNGERITQERSFGPGSLVSSPPFCGHEWDNNSGAHQANLVLGYPAFDGNLYLRPDDPRLDQGGEPFAYHPDNDIQAYLESGAAFDRLDLPILEGRLSRLFVRERYTLPASDGANAVLYAVSGEGSLQGAGTQRAITSGTLLVFQRPEQVEIKATPDQPLALYLFEPPIKQ